MKKIKNLLSKVDFFGVRFSFRYKNKDTYTTSLGGLFFILFVITSMFVIIYYFIPFINRENYSVIYFNMNLPKTEQVILKESNASFAIGLSCNADRDNGLSADDLFVLESRYIIYKKDRNGNKNKIKEILPSHPCTYSDFNNNYNEQFDILDINNLQCLDKIDHVIEGIYTDEVFSYYEFSVVVKEDTPQHFDKIYNYLIGNDCYLELYYIDISFDLTNHKKPIKPYMNSYYIQLNPLNLIKTNIYFMNQYFDDDDYLVFVYDRKDINKQILFSRTEDITFYKGKDRGITKPVDYECYAKFYIRADIKRTEIKRKYQKIMEFYADVYSLLLALFYLLILIFNFINSFYADHSLGKKIFIFKEIKHNNFDIYKKYGKIKKLIDLTEPIKISIKQNNNEYIPGEQTPKEKDNLKNNILIEKESQNLNSTVKDEVKTYDIKKNKVKNKVKIKISKSSAAKKELNKTKNKNKGNNQNILLKNSVNSTNRLNSKSNNIFEIKNILKNNEDNTELELSEENNKEKIDYSYNIFEIIITSFFSCCISKKLKLKNNINAMVNNIIFNKLEIILYIRNMLLLDILNKLILDENKSNIIEFLIHPKIFLNSSQNNKNEKYFVKYSEDDFNNLDEEITNLIQKKNKIKIDKKLISLSNQELKKLI